MPSPKGDKKNINTDFTEHYGTLHIALHIRLQQHQSRTVHPFCL